LQCKSPLSAIMRVARFHFLGWSVPDQSRGGFTAKGSPGERDLLLQRDSTILAVIEAVVCKPLVSHVNLTCHFKKLFAYATCRLFFYLTYAYITPLPSWTTSGKRRNATHLLDSSISAAKISSLLTPGPQALLRGTPWKPGEVRVVFLVFDMSQNRQKEAAKAVANSSRHKRHARATTIKGRSDGTRQAHPRFRFQGEGRSSYFETL
jgi:hypothetical protein